MNLLFIYIRPAESSSLCGFSPFVVSGGYPLLSSLASHCGGFSCCTAWALGHMVFSSCVSQALELGLSCGTQAPRSMACGNFWDQESNLCPCVGSGFLPTVPPGKSMNLVLIDNINMCSLGSCQKCVSSNYLLPNTNQWIRGKKKRKSVPTIVRRSCSPLLVLCHWSSNCIKVC